MSMSQKPDLLALERELENDSPDETVYAPTTEEKLGRTAKLWKKYR